MPFSPVYSAACKQEEGSLACTDQLDLCIVLQGYLKAVLAACNKTEPTGDVQHPAAAPGPGPGSRPSATARVGVRCLALLLKSLSHFNHAFDILQVGL